MAEKWISVDERLPENLLEVFVCSWCAGVAEIDLGYYSNEHGGVWFSRTQTDHDGDRATIENVTHWMSFSWPEPPQSNIEDLVMRLQGRAFSKNEADELIRMIRERVR